MANRAPVTGVLGTIFGATALAGVLSQSSGNGGGGVLGNLFGNNADNGAMAVYKAQKMDAGQEASTELSILKNYILPLMQKVGAIETQATVTGATTPLLIGIASEKATTDLKEAMSCVIKGTPMLRPEQIGDPYHGSFNEILTRHTPYPRVFGWENHGHNHHGCGCGPR